MKILIFSLLTPILFSQLVYGASFEINPASAVSSTRVAVHFSRWLWFDKSWASEFAGVTVPAKIKNCGAQSQVPSGIAFELDTIPSVSAGVPATINISYTLSENQNLADSENLFRVMHKQLCEALSKSALVITVTTQCSFSSTWSTSGECLITSDELSRLLGKIAH